MIKLIKANCFGYQAQVKGPVELHPAELEAVIDEPPDPKVEKIRSGFGSPQDGQFKFSFEAPMDWKTSNTVPHFLHLYS